MKGSHKSILPCTNINIYPSNQGILCCSQLISSVILKHTLTGGGPLSPCIIMGSTHINHWVWSQAASTWEAKETPKCHKRSNIHALCTCTLTQNVLHCFSGSPWKCWCKIERAIEQQNYAAFLSCLSQHCPQLLKALPCLSLFITVTGC